jgi:glycine/D-amino acid oxidase-like deaminating enzyme
VSVAVRRGGSIAVVGGGVFGVTAAIELRRRGHRVRLFEAGCVPRPEASSTDRSKAVRLDYGRDGFYVDLAALALDGWRRWNREWGEATFHEVGILLLSAAGIDAGGFESESYRTLGERGLPVERLGRQAIGARFPAWSRAAYADGYFNPLGGWAESSRVMTQLIGTARSAGVEVLEHRACRGLSEDGSRVQGVVLDGGEVQPADLVLVAAGAWTGELLPQLSGLLWATEQSVVWLRPADPRPYEGARFPVFCADIARSGWYGFPVTRDGLLKIGNHGPGRRHLPGEPLTCAPTAHVATVEFAARTFPDLAGAPVADARLCLYCDTWDGDFLVGHDPDRPGLVVASGGSGHAFKFAPVLGAIVADVVEGRANPHAARFAWRAPGTQRFEAARSDS